MNKSKKLIYKISSFETAIIEPNKYDIKSTLYPGVKSTKAKRN